MEENNFGIGSKVMHPQYGTGIVVDKSLDAYTIWVKHRGDVEIPLGDDRLQALNFVEPDKNKLTLNEVKSVIEGILEEKDLLPSLVELGDKWVDGTMSLNPSNPSLKSKEIPIDTFFHKIVMLRDRIRVMEQKINSNKKMSDEDKVDLQQYITRMYGSLTTFNVLFKYKDDHFKGDSGSR